MEEEEDETKRHGACRNSIERSRRATHIFLLRCAVLPLLLLSLLLMFGGTVALTLCLL